jgi:phosphatidylserine decarboxylase
MNRTSLLYNITYVTKLIIFVIILIILGFYFKNKYIKYVGILLLFFIIFFFRNNIGTITQNNKYFISPSSSKIKNIGYNENETVIYTYLSPLDRHFMIAPVDCTITNIENIKIKDSDTERLRVTFKDINENTFSLDQIVSKLGQGAWLLKFLYKTRCVVFNKVGDKLEQGQRYGLIRFGSNMQYNLPKSYKILTTVNSKVKLGDVIASI